MNCDSLKQCSSPHCTMCSGMTSVNLAEDLSQALEDSKSPNSCNNPLSKFQSWMTTQFYRLGYLIALKPSYFILLPIFVAVIGFTGIQQVRYVQDVETLFYPSGGPAPRERAIIEHYFPLNYSGGFLPLHKTRMSGAVRLLVKATDGETILRASLWHEIFDLNEQIENVTIQEGHRTLSYHDLCARQGDECHYNSVLNLYPEIDFIENGSTVVNYPFMIYPLIFPMHFGGIRLNQEETYIETAQALQLNYFLNLNTIHDQERAAAWESEFLRFMETKSFDLLHVSYFASRSMEDLITENPESIKPYVPLTVVLMLFFSMASAWSADWVRSKVYMGAMGIASALMGTGAAFGFLMYCDVPMSSINAIIPFLMVGIGVDDMFVVLSAFRRTNLQDSNARRLGDTYAEAGISVTITSLTNFVSFMIGLTTNIMAVRLFCIYTAASIFFTYVFHLTFFGGCLAIAGHFEKNQRHALLCFKTKAKSQTESRIFSALCAGGINPSDPWNKKDNKEHIVMVFFRDYLGKFLTFRPVKFVVVLVFCVYLGGAVYGITRISEGLDRRKLVRDDSYIVDYYDMEDQLFRKFPYNIQVLISGNVTYSDPETREQILDLHEKILDLPYVADSVFMSSWLRNCYKSLDKNKEVADGIRSEEDFIKVIQQICLENESLLNVAFNEDETRIEASRFVIQTYEVNDTIADTLMMNAFRKIAEESPLNVTVFNPNFILFDQYGVVREAVMQATLLAAGAMVVISLIFIPNPWCSVLVFIAIISIEAGVLGYMSLWDVSLDPISMVTLIMCIGFSVDFSAHVSYSYLTAKSRHPNDKIRECLYCLGLPIMQGGLSTMVSICTFILVPSYAYVAFFKVIFLVVTFAVVHGLLVIPVMLSILGPDSCGRAPPPGKDSSTISDSATPITTDESLANPSPQSLKVDKKLAFYRNFELRRVDPEGCSVNGIFINEESKSPKDSSSEEESSLSSQSNCSSKEQTPEAVRRLSMECQSAQTEKTFHKIEKT